MKIKIKIKNHFFYCFVILFITFFVISQNTFFSTKTNIKDLIYKDGKIKCALFTSQHDIISVLLELINSEKKSIKLAIYMLTHKDITAALINAKQERGITIEVVTGYDGYHNSYSKFALLEQSSIPMYLFGSANSKDYISALMHNKFIIFEENIEGKSLIWTGSFNFTKNAQAQNKENVIILEDSHIISLYKQEFEILKKHSELQPNNRFKEKITFNKNKNKPLKKTKPKEHSAKLDFLKTMKIKIS
ncbi:MAG: phospholipase D-like domain-containing protein [Candidatus Babeliales bacterium]|nr:phospholipase D-like domain-containing protein [Candidatus Babeliales bacterium]